MKGYFNPEPGNMLADVFNLGFAPTGPVLNERFKEWRSHIEKNLLDRTPECGEDYSVDPDKSLFEECKNHAGEYQTGCTYEDAIMLVHPLYLYLSHWHELKNDRQKSEAKRYLKNLTRLLRVAMDYEVSTLLIETVHHYAAATSLFVERGMIGKVVFTRYDAGIPINETELKRFEEDTIFFGGGYNGRCLTGTVGIMFKEGARDMFLITDVSLNSPKDSENLNPEATAYLNQERVISLEEAINRMNPKTSKVWQVDRCIEPTCLSAR